MKRSEYYKKIKCRLKKVSISTSDGFLLIDHDSILYLQADNNYTVFHLTDGSKIVATKHLGFFEKKLVDEPFLRIHNSFLVNLTKVTKYVKSSSGHVVVNHKSLPVSRSKKDEVLLFFQ